MDVSSMIELHYWPNTDDKSSCLDGSGHNCPHLKRHVDEANRKSVTMIIGRYGEILSRCYNVKLNHAMEVKRLEENYEKLFIGEPKDKLVACEILFLNLAERYYKELRKEMEKTYKRNCSKKKLKQLKGFDDIFISNEFVEDKEFRELDTRDVWLEERELLRGNIQQTLLERISYLTSVKEEWLKQVSKQQYEYFEAFTLMANEEKECHWIEINKEDDRLLELVGYTVLKKTQSLPEYLEEEMAMIKPIAEVISSQSVTNPITLSCVFIIYELENKDVVEPVFRVQNSGQVIFIDVKGRVYLDWKDFEINNQLPDCLYCQPLEGEYNKTRGFQVAFTWSPASYTTKKLFGVLDVFGKVVTVGSAAALGAAAAIPTLPMVAVGGTVAAVASGAYGISRGISKIVDKMTHEQSVGTQDVVSLVSNGLSVASGGISEVVPAVVTMGHGVLYTQSAVQGLNAITTLIPEYKTNVTLHSGELPMKTLLLFNSKSPDEAINNIRKAYNLTSDNPKSNVIKFFVEANSIESTSNKGVERYFSKSLTSLVLNLLDKQKRGTKINLMNMLFLRDTIFTDKFASLYQAFNEASDRQRNYFFDLLMDNVQMVSTVCATSVIITSYRGVEFYKLKDVFEQIDFTVLANAKDSFTVEKYLDTPTRKKLQFYITEILTSVFSEDEISTNGNWSLNHFIDHMKSNLSTIFNRFPGSKDK